MTYHFIDQHKDQWPVRWLCETLEVSLAAYYAWHQGPRRASEQRRNVLLMEIQAIHVQLEILVQFGFFRIFGDDVYGRSESDPSCGNRRRIAHSPWRLLRTPVKFAT